MKVYFEIVSEIVSGHTYHSFTLTYVLTSRPHEGDRTANNWSYDLRFPHYFYLGTSEFYVGTGPGKAGCSYIIES